MVELTRIRFSWKRIFRIRASIFSFLVSVITPPFTLFSLLASPSDITAVLELLLLLCVHEKPNANLMLEDPSNKFNSARNYHRATILFIDAPTIEEN